MAKGSTGSVRRLDTGYFSAAIQELNSAIQTLDSALRGIANQTRSLQSCWEGEGAKKFNAAYGRLKDEFNDQKETLETLRDNLQKMLETYEAWDAQAKNDISGNGGG